MADTNTFHGWKVTQGVVEAGNPIFPNHVGSPMVAMEKKDRNAITIVGRPGTDPEVMVQRGKVDALQQDVDASPPNDRAAWEKRLAHATRERDDAEALRSLAAGMAAARAAAETEE